MIFNSTIKFLVMVLASITILAGCGNKSDQKSTVKLWVMGSEGQVIEQLIPAFEKQNPNIHVQIQQIPWSAAHEKLLTAYAGNTLPDVFQLGNTWIPEFVALNAVEPLNEYIKASTIVDEADYFEGIADTNRLDNVYFAVPWYVDTRLLFYRTDLLKKVGFEQPPRTWDEWLRMMQRIKASVGTQGYGVLLPANEWAPLVILAMQKGATLLSDHDQYADFKSQAFRQALTYYVDLYRQQLAPPVSNTQISNLYQEFANGLFAFYISGPWNIGEFRARLPATLQKNWMTAPMPSPDGTYPGISLAGGASLAISKASEKKAAAWKFIEYMSESDNQVEFYKLTGDLPARKSAWQNAILRDDIYTQAFWAQLQHVEPTPKIPEWQQITSRITQYVEIVVRERMSIDEALAALDKDVNQLLEKRRWILNKTTSASKKYDG